MDADRKLGTFIESLKRNNKQIRDDRAQAIAEDCQLVYRRRIEDTEMAISRFTRDLSNMLDLSPDTATSLKLAINFNATEFVTTREELVLKLRNEKIRLEELKKDYEELFGGN